MEELLATVALVGFSYIAEIFRGIRFLIEHSRKGK